MNPLRKESTSYTEHSLIDVNVALLEQILDFFNCTLSTDEQLILPSRIIPTYRGGTIGKHLRHILDHYNALFQSIPLSCSIPVRTVDYDDRTRDTSIESSITLIRRAISQLQAHIQCLCSDEGVEESKGSWVDEKIQIRVKSDVEGRAGDVLLESTIGRELYFTFHHAIHHLAMVRVIATAELNLEVPSSFGVAPSTLAARNHNQNHQDQKQGKPDLHISPRNTSRKSSFGFVSSRI